MFHNYLKVGLRNINKNRVFSLINVFGLAIGLAGALIVFQYVSFELSFNKFHANSKNIYRVSYSKEKNGVESFHTVLTYSGVGPLLKQKFPEVLDFTRLRPFRTITANANVTYLKEVFEEDRVYFADPSFLTMFSFEMLEGDSYTALNDQYTGVITQTTARKYFGEGEAIGKTIRIDNNLDITITGVIQDVPINSHVKFDFLLSHATVKAIMPERWTEHNLNRFHGHLYVAMEPQTDMDQFKSKLPQFVDEYVGGLELKENGTVLKLGVMPLEDIHLHSNIEHESEVNGDYRTVNYLSIIALMILLTAWVNYINLSTARAIERASEVGVRKVLGADRSQIIRQFLLESALINVVAIVLAVVLVGLFQPLFHRLGASHILAVNIWTNQTFWVAIVSLLFFGIIISGLYPALGLSAFRPVEVLKGGNFKTGKGSNLRKVLVVFQFSATAALLVGTSTVYLQMEFMRDQDLGIELDRALVVRAPLIADSTYIHRIQSFKSQLINNARIKNVTTTSDIPGRQFNSATWYKKYGESDDNAQFSYRASMDETFIPTLDIEVVAGRNFVATDNNSATILNETAAELFQFASPDQALGGEIAFTGSDGTQKLDIIGVIKDYHHLSPKIAYAPQVMNYSPDARNYYIIKFKPGDNPTESIQQTLALIKKTYTSSFEGNPFNYFFLDEEFQKQYNADEQFGNLLGFFTLLTLLVACLGLFGLSSYTVLRRTKEIGIKKILGSSIYRILKSLSKDYIILILIANLVSWPVIYHLMQDWLQGFVHHIPLYWWLFPLAGLFITLIALLTVSFHTIKAAAANPIDSLRYE